MALPHQVQLLSSDGEIFEVSREVAKKSVTIENTIDGAFDETTL